MAEIRTTGNDRIDTATSEIAVALRDAQPVWHDQHYYDEAMRLRDEIMAGTTELRRELAAEVLMKAWVDEKLAPVGLDQRRAEVAVKVLLGVTGDG